MRITQPTAIVLDESPLSLLTQKRGHVQGDACRVWYAQLIRAHCHFYVPEIADYELRRELLRTGRINSVARLDAFNAAAPGRYLPLTTADVHLAAALWAQARNIGRMGAPPEALDGDALIAAQSLRLDAAGLGLATMVVATVNVGHLSTFTHALLWSDIQP